MSRRPDGPPSGQPDSKRARNDPPPAFNVSDLRARIAASKAAVEARVAATASSSAAQPPPPASSSSRNERDRDRDRDRDHQSRSYSRRSRSPPPSRRKSTPPSSNRDVGPAALPPPPIMDSSVADKIAAVKKKIDAMTARSANPYLSGSGSMPKSDPASASAGASAPVTSSSRAPPPDKPVGVTSIALHPLLMGGQATAQEQQEKNEKKALRDRYKPMAPKFSSVRANAGIAAGGGAGAATSRQAPVATIINPYASTPITSTPGTGAPRNADPAQEGGVAKPRRSKKLNFSAQGKYVEQGNVLRNEAKMEALKQRIAEASRKAGLDSEFDSLERSLKRQPPPEVEWWDKAILPEGGSYDDIDSAINWITTSQDSLVTHLVQHPIPIPAPGDKKPDERGLMLTKKEQKKMRRQRRQAELEDKRDRQKMGLLPPDPPKVRLANLMKVLTSDAVQDPTKIEMKVKKEVAARAHKHEKDNSDRKLSAEERKEKEYQQLVAKERKGIYASVYKIKYLSNGRHRFKVRETAKKDRLSGVCIFNPNFALVLVEGVDTSIKHYRQLMLNRIDWTEQSRPLKEGDQGSEAGSDAEADADAKKDGDEAGADSLADNKCEIIWEGEVPERTFKFFRARHSESDNSAKEWLTPKWEGMWDLAKRWVWTGEDL